MNTVKVQWDAGCNGFITIGEESMRVLPEFLQQTLEKIGCGHEYPYLIKQNGDVFPIIEGIIGDIIGNIK